MRGLGMESAADIVSAGGTTVTASKRLARRLREVTARRALKSGAEVWATPDILPWSSWTNRLWRDYGMERCERRLLSVDQASALWSDVVAGHPYMQESADVSRAAQLMYESWRVFCDWGLTLRDLKSVSRTADQIVFSRIVDEFCQLLVKKAWLDPAQLNTALSNIDFVFNGQTVPVRLVGFHEFSRTQLDLIESVAESGMTVQVGASDATCPDRARRVLCETPDHELLNAGLWARKELEADPDARLAIIVPGMAELTERKAGLVKETLAPGWQLLPKVRSLNVSYGKSLNKYPLIAALITLVDGLLYAMDFDRLSTLLRNNTICGAECGDLARLELEVRDLPEQDWTPDALRRVASDGDYSDQTMRWLEELSSASETLRDWQGANTPNFWAKEIDQVASRFRHLSDEGAGSEEHQLRNAWRETLNELANLTTVLPRLRGTHAWSWVKMRLSTALFQPESTAFAVELMGPLEAIGQQFDGIWFAGLDATSWPLQRTPDALIPRALQRERGMPGARPEDSVGFSNRVLYSVLSAATRSIVSSAKKDGDIELQPSPSIDGIRLVPEPGYDGPPADRYAASLTGEASTLIHTRDCPRPVADDERIRGGYGVLELQRSLPIAAFGRYRLGARPIERAETGLGAAARGNLIHGALERLLPAGTSSESLTRDESRFSNAAIGAAVSSASRRLWRGADGLLSVLIRREERRCRALLARFLRVERERPPFSILDSELHVQLQISELRLNLRIDRIDRVSQGKLVIDYKTGRQPVTVTRNDGSLAETQLAAYALALKQQGDEEIPAGLGIARVHGIETEYRGVWLAGDEPGFGGFKSVAAQSDLPDSWYRELEGLGAQFCDGVATVPPELNRADLRPWRALIRGFRIKHND